MKIQPTKMCRVCKSVFSKPPHLSYVAWNMRETCSKICGATHKNKQGTYESLTKICKNPDCHKLFIKSKKNTHAFFERQQYCSISCGKTGKRKGKLNNKWLGDDVTYVGLHAWMRKNFGKPQFCERCKRSDARMYHWANISGKYVRDRNDWIRLCVPCHKKSDLTQKMVLL
jgi:hypothetical protein